MISVARPIKQGLDYFALDVTMNDEVEIIEAEHGLEGFAILIKLFQKIYSEGYYYEWGDKEQILFSNRISVDRNKVASIVLDCVKWNIFSQDMFDKYNILTSRRIQNHYFTSVYKRVNVEAFKEYLLIDLSDRLNVIVMRVTDIGNLDTSMVTDDKSTQSKEKESKVNKSIVNNNNGDSCPQVVDNSKDENLSVIATAFQQNGFGTINATIKELLVELLEEYPFEWIEPAIKKAVESNIRKLSYVKGILKNWNANGGMQLESVDKPKPKAKVGAPNRFHNFDQRSSDYTAEELNNKVDEIAKKKRAEARERYKNQGGSNDE